MAHDKQKIFEQAKDAIEKHKLFFIEDVVAFLPISRSSFYEYYPASSDEMDELKELLNKNKIEVKTSMRSKWYKSDNATLQMALMKLIATDEERRRLSMTYSQVEQTNIERVIDWGIDETDSKSESTPEAETGSAESETL
jgi:hypothetical protein